MNLFSWVKQWLKSCRKMWTAIQNSKQCGKGILLPPRPSPPESLLAGTDYVSCCTSFDNTVFTVQNFVSFYQTWFNDLKFCLEPVLMCLTLAELMSIANLRVIICTLVFVTIKSHLLFLYCLRFTLEPTIFCLCLVTSCGSYCFMVSWLSSISVCFASSVSLTGSYTDRVSPASRGRNWEN